MSGVWKPGDVAIVTDNAGRTGRGICNTMGGWDFTVRGASISSYCGAREVRSARPLVVIDPEDTVAVERLVTLFLNQFPSARQPEDDDAMQAALREFADPKPQCTARISLDYGDQGSHHECEEAEGHVGPHKGTGLAWFAGAAS